MNKLTAYFKTASGLFFLTFVISVSLMLIPFLFGENQITTPFVVFGFASFVVFLIFWTIIFPIWKFIRAFQKDGFGLFKKFYNTLLIKIQELIKTVVGAVVSLFILGIIIIVGGWFLTWSYGFVKDLMIPAKWTLFYYATAEDTHEATSKVRDYGSKNSCMEAGLRLINDSDAMRRGAWYECGYKCRYMSDLGLTEVCKEVCDEAGNCSK